MKKSTFERIKYPFGRPRFFGSSEVELEDVREGPFTPCAAGLKILCDKSE
jgi:hypothetical protein